MSWRPLIVNQHIPVVVAVRDKLTLIVERLRGQRAEVLIDDRIAAGTLDLDSERAIIGAPVGNIDFDDKARSNGQTVRKRDGVRVHGAIVRGIQDDDLIVRFRIADGRVAAQGSNGKAVVNQAWRTSWTLRSPRTRGSR